MIIFKYESMLFIKQIEFDRLGAFPYSREDGTVAASFKGQIPGFIKKKRADNIMKTQQDIIFANKKTMLQNSIRQWKRNS